MEKGRNAEYFNESICSHDDVGYTIHARYNTFRNVFRRFSRFIECPDWFINNVNWVEFTKSSFGLGLNNNTKNNTYLY